MASDNNGVNVQPLPPQASDDLDEYQQAKRYQVRVGVGGIFHMCECGCNMFYRPHKNQPNNYRCYACGEPYNHNPKFEMTKPNNNPISDN